MRSVLVLSEKHAALNTSLLLRAKKLSFGLELNQQPWDVTEALL
jgi:hypothetical protein